MRPQLSLSLSRSSNAVSSSRFIRHFTPPAVPRREDHQRKDIIPGDLKATLDAHRVSNRSARIYKVEYGDVEAESLVEPKDVRPPPEVAESVTDRPSGPTDQRGQEKESLVRFYSNKYEFDGIITDAWTPAKERKVAVTYKNIRKRGAISQRNRAGDCIVPATYSKGKVIEFDPEDSTRRAIDFKPWQDAWSNKAPGRATRLSRELLNLQGWLQLTPLELNFRHNLALMLIDFMKRQDQDLAFWHFGSMETGYATTMSDIDLGFLIPSRQKAPGERGPSSSMGNASVRKDVHKRLERMLIAAISENKFYDHEIVYARYSLLRMRHRNSHVEIQIVAGNPQPLVVELIKGYTDEHPQLMPIFMAVKTALAARDLDEPRLGGIGSYALLMMIVAAFKIRRLPRVATHTHALLTFLAYYMEFDTYTNCVGLDPPRVFPKRNAASKAKQVDLPGPEDSVAFHAEAQLSKVDENMPYRLCLQDPADPFNDLGYIAYRIMDIKATFGAFHDKIRSWMNKGPLDDESSPLEYMLGGTLHQFQMRRSDFENWAVRETGRAEMISNSKIAHIVKEQKQGLWTTTSKQGQMTSYNSVDIYKSVDELVASYDQREERLISKKSNLKLEDLKLPAEVSDGESTLTSKRFRGLRHDEAGLDDENITKSVRPKRVPSRHHS